MDLESHMSKFCITARKPFLVVAKFVFATKKIEVSITARKSQKNSKCAPFISWISVVGSSRVSDEKFVSNFPLKMTDKTIFQKFWAQKFVKFFWKKMEKIEFSFIFSPKNDGPYKFSKKFKNVIFSNRFFGKIAFLS